MIGFKKEIIKIIISYYNKKYESNFLYKKKKKNGERL